jgi:hypothetical protein
VDEFPWLPTSRTPPYLVTIPLFEHFGRNLPEGFWLTAKAVAAEEDAGLG